MARVVVAPASFKGYASPGEAASAMAEGVRSLGHEAIVCPLADGGEGTLDALAARGGRVLWARTVNPLGQPRRARYLLWPERRHVFIELAEAAGWSTIPRRSRNLWEASTYGVGLLLCRALQKAPRTVSLGLGGSATNDGGAGLLAALGAIFTDGAGNPVPPTPRHLLRLRRINLEPARERLASVRLEFLADVDNPLLGPEGATYMFARQKGARAADLPLLETALRTYAEVLSEASGRDHTTGPFGGAAGGTATALLALGASPLPGARTVARFVRLKEALRQASLCLTGEGRLDVQTLHGKAPFLVVETARRFQVPVAMLVGQDGPNLLADKGVRLFPVTPPGLTPAEIRRSLPRLLAETARRAVASMLGPTSA